MKMPLIILYAFNMIVGNYILYVIVGKNGVLLEKLLLYTSYSISCIILLTYLARQFQTRTHYFALFVLNFLTAFMIPVLGTFIFCLALSIVDENFSLNLGIIFCSLVTGIVSVFFWLTMGVINFGILSWYKEKLPLDERKKKMA